MDEDFEGELESEERLELEPKDVADDLITADSSWEGGGSIQLPSGKVWRPDLVRDDRSALLHVHLADRLRSYAITRFELALEGGIEVHVATTLGRLYDNELLTQLAAADALVHVIEDDAPPRRVLAVLADAGMTVPPDVRSRLAGTD